MDRYVQCEMVFHRDAVDIDMNMMTIGLAYINVIRLSEKIY